VELQHTPLINCFVLKPTVFKDSRGTFCETFNAKLFKEITNIDVLFVQDNQSKSSYGVLRGLHFQKDEFAQAKLVRVVKGKVLDVVVDLRKDSKTYGKHFSIELSESNNLQLFVPRGFAHGFVTLSEEAIFAYKCDNYYHAPSEGGIIYIDPTLNIDWKLNKDVLLISDKDKELATFQDALL